MFSQLDSYTCQLIASFVGNHPVYTTNLRATCRWMRDAIPPPERMRADELLREAARLGNRALCDFAVSKGVKDYSMMLYGAAEGGHRALCEEARELGANDWNVMLSAAALGGQRAMCELAREWGAYDWDEMLTSAAFGGHAEICRLAAEWGASAWSSMRAMVLPGGEDIRALADELEKNYRQRRRAREAGRH